MRERQFFRPLDREADARAGLRVESPKRLQHLRQDQRGAISSGSHLYAQAGHLEGQPLADSPWFPALRRLDRNELSAHALRYEPSDLQISELHEELAGPAEPMNLQLPRTASSGRRLTSTSRGAS